MPPLAVTTSSPKLSTKIHANVRITDAIVEYTIGEKAGPFAAGSSHHRLAVYPIGGGAVLEVGGHRMLPGDLHFAANRTRHLGPITKVWADGDGYAHRDSAMGESVAAIFDAVAGASELKPLTKQPVGDPKPGDLETVTFSYWRESPGARDRTRMQRTFPIDAVPADLRAALSETQRVLGIVESVAPHGTLLPSPSARR